MKKKILVISAGITAILMIGISMQTLYSPTRTSLLQANIEAITQEEGGITITCNRYPTGKGQCWRFVSWRRCEFTGRPSDLCLEP